MIIVKCECGLQTPIRVWPFYCRCRRVYASNGDQPRLTSAAAMAFEGPGTELKKLLAELGISSFAGCECDSKAARMNRWGVEGCRERFETIRSWMIEAQDAAGWKLSTTAAYRAVVTGLAFEIDPLDVAGSLVGIAIKRADQRT